METETGGGPGAQASGLDGGERCFFSPPAADNFRPVPPPRAATPDFVFSPVSMKTLLFYLLKNNKATTYISRLV